MYYCAEDLHSVSSCRVVLEFAANIEAPVRQLPFPTRSVRCDLFASTGFGIFPAFLVYLLVYQSEPIFRSAACYVY